MTHDNYKDIIARFSDQTIAVIGDVMLDQYVFGSVERISPEAPIPIVQQSEVQLVPGGAGNTAANVAALGARCHLLGVIGEDKAAEDLKGILESFSIDTDGLITDSRPTTVKTRVIGNHQQIVRIDHETSRSLESSVARRLLETIRHRVNDCQAMIVCDYAKGVIQADVMEGLKVIAKEHDIPLLVDPRPEHKDLYRNVDFLTPNKKETGGMMHHPVRNEDDARKHGLALANELESNLLLTMSEEGMLLIDQQTGEMDHLPTKAQEVVDVSGAGDTVIATFGLSLAAGATPLAAAMLATHAASLVVSKLGTATLTQDELTATF